MAQWRWSYTASERYHTADEPLHQHIFRMERVARSVSHAYVADAQLSIAFCMDLAGAPSRPTDCRNEGLSYHPNEHSEIKAALRLILITVQQPDTAFYPISNLQISKPFLLPTIPSQYQGPHNLLYVILWHTSSMICLRESRTSELGESSMSARLLAQYLVLLLLCCFVLLRCVRKSGVSTPYEAS